MDNTEISERRKKIFRENRSRLHLRCRNCSTFFLILRKNFRPEVAITCPECGKTDLQADREGVPFLEYFITAMSIQRWREGFTALNKKLPSDGNTVQFARIPFWLLDWVAPVLSRFEWIVLERLIQFSNSSGWCWSSQRTIAFYLSQFHAEGNHIPARSNVSVAFRELWRVQVHYKVLLENERGWENRVRWLLDESWEGLHKRGLKVRLDFPAGAIIVAVIKSNRI